MLVKRSAGTASISTHLSMVSLRLYGLVTGGVALLAAFAVIETKIADPMFHIALFKIRAFTAGSIAGLLTAIARGGPHYRRYGD